MRNEKINAIMILEAIGKPAEHLTTALNNLVGEVEKEKGVIVLNKILNEPAVMKDRKDLYTAFVELEIEVEEILHIAILMFKYMPSHIEIISPELIALTNNGWNDLFNELTRRLHGYDEVARVIQIEKNILEKKLRDLLKEKK